ncbi:hypothetical protein LTR16_000747 [Cryomyces antarcticus]|uniref:Uncharacterized protein n=1 Tax=Cryomyces antarcticus TaxID=329879 RepID=A0ABR0LZT5_9PEZI|nr:hypothetical protein LTR16_000747 [Cryomyces antarcticus]
MPRLVIPWFGSSGSSATANEGMAAGAAESNAFLHSHRSGFLNAWHTDTPMHDDVYAMEHLQLEFVRRNGYVNLRCKWNPGCIKAHRQNRHITNEIWQTVFNDTSTPPPRDTAISGLALEAEEKAFSMPAEVGAACCAQFVVSREQVRKRPWDDYMS